MPVLSVVSASRQSALEGLDRLCQFYENLSPQSLQTLSEVYASQARFRDPFNDVQGTQAITHIFDDMFKRAHQPRFVITGRVQQGLQAFVTWDFSFGMGGQVRVVQGCSQLRFDAEGLVLDHRDYWDTANELYVHLPVVGWLMRWLRRKLSAGGS
jgi:hypothetical protein